MTESAKLEKKLLKNKSVTSKIKDLQNLSNKEIYVTLNTGPFSLFNGRTL